MQKSSNDFPALLKTLEVSYPNIIFKPSHRFRFHPPQTIFYDPKSANAHLLILHELGHALIDKNTYQTDIERLKIESEAWNQAKIIAESLQVTFDNDFAEQNLNSYRDWLHQKSLCKKCHLTRFQTPDGIYHCPHCEN